MFPSNTEIEREFGVSLIRSEEMEGAVRLWGDISSGSPPWLDPGDDIETVNMAKHISDTRAKLTALDFGIAVSGPKAVTDGDFGPERAEFLQRIADDLVVSLPEKIAEANALGGMVIKWNGTSWDFVMPDSFGITAKDGNGQIIGAIFANSIIRGKERYTRLEYHRYEGWDERTNGGVYVVTNRAFRCRLNAPRLSGLFGGRDPEGVLGVRIPLQSVPEWADLAEEVRITNLKKPLFAYYRVPGKNAVDSSSPLGISVFANAITELKAVDIAISRKNSEIEDSKHITFVGQTLIRNARSRGIKLPRFVKGLGIGIDDGEVSAINEHVPTLLTDARITDINFDLSLLGVKCGFSEGEFVLDGRSGMVTATQIESDDRDTLQTVKVDRDALKAALKQAIYGADALTTLYGLAPEGEYELNFNFGDLTYSYEKDKQTWFSYVAQGYVPFWYYLKKFEGIGEAEAKRLSAEQSPITG